MSQRNLAGLWVAGVFVAAPLLRAQCPPSGNQACITFSASPSPAPFGASVHVSVSASGAGPAVTGGVKLAIDGTTYGLSSLSSGVADFTVTATPSSGLGIGGHTLSIQYGGDANYVAQVSGSTGLNVVQASTNVSTPTFSGTPNPGQTITISATLSVTSPGSGAQVAPTGTIAFKDGGTPIGSAAASLGGASISTSGLAAGLHSITATYSGDANFLTSTSGALSLTIGKLASSVSVSAGSGSLVFGQTTTYIATVSPSAATGTVTFLDNGSPISGAIAVSGGQAQFTPATPLAVGSHSITANYSGDNTYSSSSGGGAAVGVGKASTAITLNVSAGGSSISFTATVAVVSPGAGTPTGTVQFVKNGGSAVANGSLAGNAASGTAAATFGSFTAVYAGDSNFNGSTSAAFNVPQPKASLSLASSLSPAPVGQAVTFTGTLTVTSGAGTPTGTIQFSDGSTSLGSASVSSGQATLNVSGLTVGSHAISAQYSGDNLFAAVSASLTQVVGPISTSLSLSASSTSPTSVQPVTFTVTVGPAPPAGVPAQTGQITISDGGAPLGTVAATGGSVSVGALSEGTHQIQASYAGDQNWTSASASITVKVGHGALTITTGSLPGGTVASIYSASLVAAGGNPPYRWSISGLPTGLTADSSGNITGTPTADGTSNVAVTVTDQSGSTASASFNLAVTVSPLSISGSLPNGRTGADYSAPVSVSGGVPPYQFSISGAAGFSISSAGIVSASAVPAGTYSLTVQVTDSRGNSASKQFSFEVNGVALVITTTVLPGGTTGAAYSQTVNADGGTPPYTWTGTLPNGLSISPTGLITGNPAVFGNVSLTITVRDSIGTNVNRTYAVTFALPALPAFTVSGGSATGSPLAQIPVQASFASPQAIGGPSSFPVPLTGTLKISFQAASGGDDPAIQFPAGRTVPFTIPAGTSAALFSISGTPVNSVSLQTGTTAGVITITPQLLASTTDLTPVPPPTAQITINPSVPSISSVQATRASTGFTVVVSGFSDTREVSQAIFHFNSANGSTLQTTDLTVPVSSLFSTWYQSSAAGPFGGQFLYTQIFNVAGDTSAIASVTVTLVNSQGNSQAVTATVQ